jgi:transcriptional regulator with XRE-family HTH domain
MPKSPDPTDRHVGSRVRMRSLMLGLSQTKLAGELGLTFQQVQKYEKGANRISAGKLQHISNFLQVPIPFFFEGLFDPSNTAKHPAGVPTPAHVSELIATSDGLSLIRAYTQIKRRGVRHAIVALVEKLAS